MTEDTMQSLDIVIITKNSLQPCFAGSLDSIERAAAYANVTVRIIVVDKDSCNGTIKEVLDRSQTLNTVIISDNDGNRATARQKGIDAVQTELFAFIDSDVILEEDWIKKMMEYFYIDQDKTIGAIWGVTRASEETELAYKEALASVYRKSPTELSMAYGRKRGLTHDTMIRTEAIRGIQIPPELHVFEDHFIRKHIENNGYIWEVTSIPACYHNRHTRIEDEAFQDAYYGYQLGVHSRKWFTKHIFLWIPKLIYLYVKTRNRRLIGIEFRKEKAFLRAALRLMKERLLRCENELSL
jgi:glycosyltransferase involved in cell wall biosynthesis